MIITFFARSALDGSLLTGLEPDFLYIKRLNADQTVTDIAGVEAAEVGGGLYSFELDDALLLPNSIISYLIDLGPTANPDAREGFIYADENGNPTEAASTSYTDEGIDSRAEIQYGATSDTLTYFAKANGAPQSIDALSAFVTILDPGGSTKVPRAQTGIVITAGGKLTFTQAWASATYELWEDFVAVWEWTVGSVPHVDRQFFDVVRNKMQCLIDESDILEQYPDAQQHLLSLGVANTSRFIKRAWSVLLDRIRSGKSRPSLILDRTRLINPAIEGATARMCRALSKETGDIWHERMIHHFREYNSLIAGLGDLKYDRDEDGLAADNDVKRMNRRTATV